MAKLHFLLRNRIRTTLFNPGRPEGLAVEYASPPLSLSLVPDEPDKDPCGSQHGITCRVAESREVSRDVFEFVSALLAHRFVSYPQMSFSLPLILHGEEVIQRDGSIKSGFDFSFELLPPEVQSVCTEARTDLSCRLERFVRIARWQENAHGADWPFEMSHGLYWRAGENGLYHHVPLKAHKSEGESPAGLRWTDPTAQVVSDLWQHPNGDEPLAHQLLRDAWSIADTSPRSCLLLISSALEVGVKTHVSEAAPDTAWLLEELQSPPVYKIFKDFLPKIHHGNHRVDFEWKKARSLVSSIQKIFEDRNKLAHTGTMPGRVVLSSYYSLARDTLYLLDYLGGHEWARDHVGHETRLALGWPKSPRGRGFFRTRARDYLSSH